MRIFDVPQTRSDLRGQAFFVASWVAVTAIGAYLTPDPHGHGTHTQLGLPPCPSVLMFNRPCPGCGLTTSFTATIHGRFAEAFAAHPLGPLFYLGFTVLALAALYGLLRGWRLDTTTRPFHVVTVSAAVLLVGFGLWRAAITPGYASSTDFRAAIRSMK